MALLHHRAALALAYEASVLVAISSWDEAGGSAMTSKLTEYVALGRPVLYIAPEGPGVELVRGLNAGEVVEPGDLAGIMRSLDGLYQRWQSGSEQSVPLEALSGFDRRETARTIAATLDAAVSARDVG